MWLMQQEGKTHKTFKWSEEMERDHKERSNL